MHRLALLLIALFSASCGRTIPPPPLFASGERARCPHGSTARAIQACLITQDMEDERAWKHGAGVGDANAQYLYGLVLYYRGEQASGRRWVCQAADKGHADAQRFIGDQYRIGQEFSGIPADYSKSYMWYSLAAKNGASGAAEDKARLALNMKPAEITQAHQMATDWKPGQCSPMLGSGS